MHVLRHPHKADQVFVATLRAKAPCVLTEVRSDGIKELGSTTSGMFLWAMHASEFELVSRASSPR
jgi:hypothetical protein